MFWIWMFIDDNNVTVVKQLYMNHAAKVYEYFFMYISCMLQLNYISDTV